MNRRDLLKWLGVGAAAAVAKQVLPSGPKPPAVLRGEKGSLAVDGAEMPLVPWTDADEGCLWVATRCGDCSWTLTTDRGKVMTSLNGVNWTERTNSLGRVAAEHPNRVLGRILAGKDSP
jgi:hypothetical protein